MRKYGFWFEVIVRDDERGFLSRDGRFVRLLPPGRFIAFDPGRQLSAEVVKVVRAEIAPERALLLHRTHRPVAEQNFEIVQVGPTEVAIVSFDGEPKHLVPAEHDARLLASADQRRCRADRHRERAARCQALPRQARPGAQRGHHRRSRSSRRTRRAC